MTLVSRGFRVGRKGRHINRDIQCKLAGAVRAQERVPGPERGGRMNVSGKTSSCCDGSEVGGSLPPAPAVVLAVVNNELTSS